MSNEWITEYQMGNFCKILKDFRAVEADYSIQLYFPTSIVNLLKTLETEGDFTLLDEIKSFSSILFIPVNTGYHWILIIIDTRIFKSIVITYCDPLSGYPNKRIIKDFKAKYTFCKFKVLNERVQYDGVHCGAWCIYIASQYIEKCKKTFSPSGTLQALLLVLLRKLTKIEILILFNS